MKQRFELRTFDYKCACVCTHLDPEVSQVQFTEDFMNNLQALCIRDHGIILARDVEILGGREHTHTHTQLKVKTLP